MEINTKAFYSDEITEREIRNRKIAYEAALEGIVLLENDGALPIIPCKIALFGAGAAMTIKGGVGSGEVNERHSVSVLEGLENTGFTVTTKRWIADCNVEFQRAEEEYAADFRKKLRKLDISVFVNIEPLRPPYGRLITDEDIRDSAADTCIYVVSRQSGEGADRRIDNSDYMLSEIECANIKKVAAGYEKTIVAINAGCSMDMGFVDEIEGINAVVFLCQQGCEGGAAFADVLSGRVSPSGHLSATWAKKYKDIPAANEYSSLGGNKTEADYKEGIYVGYRYFDSFCVAPRYEFGYGLSYTEFELAFEAISVQKTSVSAQVKVSNIGSSFSGKEVVQLYVSCPDGQLRREFQSLAAFAKTRELASGEAQNITLEFDMKSLAAYDEKTACYVLAKGDYIVRIGNSSRNTKPCAVLALDGDVIVSKHENICPVQSKISEIFFGLTKYEDGIGGLPKYEIMSADFTTVIYSYKKPEIGIDSDVRRILDALTVDEMIDLAVGAGMFPKKPHLSVPGSGGNTTSSLVGKGLSNIVLCDGPAGLRMQRTSVITKKGKVKAIEAPLANINYLPKIFKKLVLGNPKDGKLIYQYATAFPVGMALAQTWNPEILEAVGRAVGEEMVEYGVTLWLAPGMNIQRNPLCGRNFEYYSEDPLLSGKLAAAITRGVQSHEGCFVTIKHFATNNQENRRNRVSSNVNERALREIYLKGFEIAVKEGGAKAVMSAYNRINGRYCPNSYDLCTKVLRNEWDFDGLVMTDWYSTHKGLGDTSLALASGNDLIMPGGKNYRKNIKEGLKSGRVSENDLKLCCANIIKLILESRTQKEFEAARQSAHNKIDKS